ncbi:hypothetical protein BSL78_01161 [Apostichopus japonicus]|uniref:Uncharacterized protein n=1 Tax=Stichopus japonicus TaxID=307972 RepID=A0A2G8LNV7_STIJA|nr:hypothetical protein BSL78_01161 [Apostichopus japonicus]
MAVSISRAYEVLGLEEGASADEIRSAYKKLALAWHPDKHENSELATKKFQEISSAYKRLTTQDEEDDVELSYEEMFELFTQLVFRSRDKFSRTLYFHQAPEDPQESFSYCLNIQRESQEKYTPKVRKKSFNNTKNDISCGARPSYTEAKRNGDSLIEEIEREKRQREKKRERKKKRKQRKREGKENNNTKSSNHHSASDSDSDSEKEENTIQSKDSSKVSSNNSNSVLQPLSSSEQTMPNKKTNSSDKKPNSSDKKQPGSAKALPGRKSTPNSHSQNGVSSRQSKTSKQADKRKQHDSGSSGEDEATQGLDLNSAFFALTVNNVAKKSAGQSQKKNKKAGGKSNEGETAESIEAKIHKSRKLAIRGNELATKGDYKAAIELFSQAISLDPNDHRFFGNRSYCFDQTGLYEKALKDAERAINLSKEWPKGYFRKGRALAGLQSFNEAEKAYEQVLKLDSACEEAVQELKKVRVCQLIDMGFTKVQSEIAVLKFGSVQDAAEALLSGTLAGSPQELDEDVYISDEEDILSETIQQAKTDVRNPEKLRSLWIGNLSQSASEKHIRDLFGKFGVIESMRRLPEKFCAFINFREAVMASEAMRCLQGYQFFESQLLIKFPDHPITDGHLQTIYLKKTRPSGDNSAPSQRRQQQQQQQQQQPQQHVQQQASQQQYKQQPSTAQHHSNMHNFNSNGASRGPVNGNECYFWRDHWLLVRGPMPLPTPSASKGQTINHGKEEPL